jgi:hypothetical protein
MEHDLKKRRVRIGTIAVWTHDMEYLLKGNILVTVSAQSHGPHPLEEGAEGDRIDKAANQFLQIGLGTIGDGRSHKNVFLAAQPTQQDLKDGEKQHKERHAFVLRQFLESAKESRRQRKGVAVPIEGLSG